jgi:dienelactone hydrolase
MPNLQQQQPQTTDKPYTVITANYSGVSYDLYCPSNYSGSLVIFAGGILGHKQYLAGWAPVLAEEGYAVLTFTTPAEDLDHVPRYVDNCKNNIQTLIPFVFDETLFPIQVNNKSVALVGMSGGGATVLAMNDTRIKTTVAICPYYINNSCVENSSPVLIITGANDTICPPDTNGLAYYNELEPNKMLIEQTDVGHDMGPAGWTDLVAWLDYFANDDTSAYPILTNVNNDPQVAFSLNEFSDLSYVDPNTICN